MSRKNVYSNLKLFSYPDRIEALRQGKLIAPVHVRIKPVNACNHSCWFCAYRADGLELGSQMQLRDRLSKEKMAEIVEDLISMQVRAVTFSGGGEPLLFSAMAETVERLARGGIKVATLTNGSFLKGAVADAFAAHGTWVRVSIDGWDGPSLAASRRVKETEFDLILGNLKAFALKKSGCSLGVSFIVTKENAGHLFEFCQKIKDAGVHHVKLSPAIVGNSGAENNRYHDAIAPVVRRQIETAMKLECSSFRIANHIHHMEERFDKSYTRCAFLQFLTIIGADAKVYTCQDKAYTESGLLGSIKDQSFKDFWFSDESQSRVRAVNPSLHCKHHCVAHQKNELLEEILALDPEHVPFV